MAKIIRQKLTPKIIDNDNQTVRGLQGKSFIVKQHSFTVEQQKFTVKQHSFIKNNESLKNILNIH